MKGIVLYKSKYGHTYTYAKWIQEALGFELRDFSKFKQKEIPNYETIIFGSGVYIGKMNQIKKVLQMFSSKSIVIFACGGHPGVEKEIAVLKETNFTEADLQKHVFFYLPGGVDYTKMKGIKKCMVSFFCKMLEKKENRTPDEEAMMSGFTNPTYYVDQKEINNLVEFVKSQR